jgi:hypothetical protein
MKRKIDLVIIGVSFVANILYPFVIPGQMNTKIIISAFAVLTYSRIFYFIYKSYK